ncbi:MAG: hypothetical protein ACKO96_32410 [Flammeovirgaceae bacterium]
MSMNLNVFWNTVRMEGVFDTLSILLIQRIMANHERRNTSYDKKYNVDTQGLISANDQKFVGGNRDSAVYYYPSSITSVRSMFKFLKTIPIKFSDYVFIDLGAGKGKPLFLASDHPFRYIIGVEASVDTCNVALQNVKTYSSYRQCCKDIRIVNEDMLNFEFPDENLLIFLGNPLVPNSPLYNTLLANIDAASKRYNKSIYLAYYCPDSHELFAQSSVIRVVKHYKSLFDSHDWVVYTNLPTS